ncbi:Ethanolamine kinase 1 [Oopsacas minuta]|uniref:ethanolamine kinase n=1 Tax=Oopsacas minuta TaxID=111878 RepID=A0AAV7KJN1_9METZ|nr:Ethanolamine kinase 1 [Oopsacas minuta]
MATDTPKYYLNAPYQDITISLKSADISTDVINLVITIKPCWKGKSLKTKLFTDGISNKLIGCYHGDKISAGNCVIVRINGFGTDKIIDRDNEIKTFNILSSIKCLNSSKLLTVFVNGLCYEYLDGDVLDENNVRDPHIAKLIAKQMANMHNLCKRIPTPITAEYGINIAKFLANMPKGFADSYKQKLFEKFPKISVLESEINIITSAIEKLNLPLVLCHNDLLLANILYDKYTDSIKFIDFEYSAFNYNCYDIGNHFAEYAGINEVDYSRYPDKEYQLEWLRNYLEQVYFLQSKDPKTITDAELQTLYIGVNLSSLAAHLYWTLWSIYQASNSTIDFDFLAYGKLRIDEYMSKKNLSLVLLQTVDKHENY